jgi:hypothetical protein
MKDLIINILEQPPSKEWIDRYAQSAKRWHTKIQIGTILAALVGLALMIFTQQFLGQGNVWILMFAIGVFAFILFRFLLILHDHYRSLVIALQPIDSELSPDIFIEFSKLLDNPTVCAYVKKIENRQPTMVEFEALKDWVEKEPNRQQLLDAKTSFNY